ncbi:MAG: PIN domain-containing protein, partial [Rubrivivax sp.]|nr:PIN domain-containing protein [Rubrivivax sp.]
MPLPKPPSKKGDLLQSADYEAQAAPRPEKRSIKTRSAEAPAQSALDLRDGLAPAVARAPAPANTRAAPTPGAVAPAAYAPLTPARQAPSALSDARPAPRKPRSKGPAKLFVLDTNVLMHDPMSLFRFEEHDIFLPMIVLEELDSNKKGMTEVARNARQASRTLDALAGAKDADIAAGLKLSTTGHREAGGCLFFQTQALDNNLPISLPQGKADNQILGVVQSLREKFAPREVVLVSKDINMRVKARALGLAT